MKGTTNIKQKKAVLYSKTCVSVVVIYVVFTMNHNINKVLWIPVVVTADYSVHVDCYTVRLD